MELAVEPVLYEVKFQVTPQREAEFRAWAKHCLDIVLNRMSPRSIHFWRELAGADLDARWITYRAHFLFSDMATLDEYLVSYSEVFRSEARERFGLALQVQRWVGTTEYVPQLALNAHSASPAL